MQQKSITVTAGLGQPRAILQTYCCHINCPSPVKNPPLRCDLSLKFFDQLLLLYNEVHGPRIQENTAVHQDASTLWILE